MNDLDGWWEKKGCLPGSKQIPDLNLRGNANQIRLLPIAGVVSAPHLKAPRNLSEVFLRFLARVDRGQKQYINGFTAYAHLAWAQ